MKKVFYAKYFIASSLLTTSLLTSIRVLYMLEYNISEGQIATIKGVFSIIVALTELPTGIIADKVSKKMSYAIGAALFALHALVYVFFTDYAGFILTQIILAFSSSFISGADVALLDDYISRNTSDKYIDIAGKIKYGSGFISAFLFLVSGVIYAFQPRLNFILTTVIGAAAFGIICSMPDTSTESEKKSGLGEQCRIYIRESVDVLKYTFTSRVIVKITFLSAIIFSLLIFNFEYYQIVLSRFDFPEQYIGILYASFMVLGGWGAKLSKQMLEKIGQIWLPVLFVLMIALSYLFIAFASGLIGILLAIIIQQVCFGSWSLIVDNTILKHVPSQEVKSTMLSMNSLVTSLYKGIIVIVLGVVLNQSGYHIAYLVMFMVMICLFVFLIVENKVQRIHCRNDNKSLVE